MHFLPALAAAAFLLSATAIFPATAQPIFRCGNTYSQEACKGGKVVEDKTTTLHSGHSGSTVYLCKGHGGGLFWSSYSCCQHNAFLERTVPFGLLWDQKIAPAEAPAVVYHFPNQPTESGDSKSAIRQISSRTYC